MKPIVDEVALEEVLSQPSQPLVDWMSRMQGDLLVLGAGGKMGPSLCRMAKRASDMAQVPRRIVAVSRFHQPQLVDQLHAWGIETQAGDLLDEGFVASLPQCENVVHMVGVKFGTSTDQGHTWVTNAFVPGLVSRHLRQSRWVVMSTGNVYPLSPITQPGPNEDDPLGPVGEYAMTALARERVFAYFATRFQFPLTIIRLNYATELRYGVLVDLARQVSSGIPIDLTMGYANVIWQPDANDMVLRSLEHACVPPRILNVTGLERISIREISARLGAHMDRAPIWQGSEAETALLSDARRAHACFGPTRVGLEEVVACTADWIRRGQVVWDKPTHFEQRNGQF